MFRRVSKRRNKPKNMIWLLVPFSSLCTYIICIFVCLCQRMKWKNDFQNWSWKTSCGSSRWQKLDPQQKMPLSLEVIQILFCCCSAVLHMLQLYCGSELWLTVCVAGWATPARSHSSLREQWMIQEHRCRLDRMPCHLSAGHIGEPEEERTKAEVRFRAGPSSHYLPQRHCSCCKTSSS